MDRDQTLPAWPNLVQLLLEHFLSALLSSKRGEEREIFFWGG